MSSSVRTFAPQTRSSWRARASPPRPRPIVLTPLREHAQPSRGSTPVQQSAAAAAPTATPTPDSPEGGQPFLPPSVSTLPACGFWGDGDLCPRAWGWPTAAPGDRGGWQCLSRWPGARVRVRRGPPPLLVWASRRVVPLSPGHTFLLAPQLHLWRPVGDVALPRQWLWVAGCGPGPWAAVLTLPGFWVTQTVLRQG